MRLIKDIHADGLATGRPILSIEFFPPKTPEGDRTLLEHTIPELLTLGPDYCSVTYGAGGSTREKTLHIVDQIQRRHGLTGMAHLTCVNATREQTAAVLVEAWQRGIRNILALRGDPPGGVGAFVPTAGGFEYSYELVRFIKEQGEFCVGTAGFPEGHIDCREGALVDWGHLKTKIDQGADFVLTQLFFDNDDFYRFRDHMVRRLGVTVPICPGVLPILSSKQLTRFTTMCGARIPRPLRDRLDALAEDDEATKVFGIEYATRQCEALLHAGVPGIHFYCLNRVRSTAAVVTNLGLVRTLAP